ncbi:2-oxoisovalerate dehydrogenase subunit beta [Botrimarina colliarenosi]|uniref:2-oxoisovalerate dehydrogenase subunit beta n=1 Tax=Botrimarina colliarenosi TaxID=2528001 RepID=A0A5C6A3F3_9BACT|nr:2-oxoisovalerate dehydrogenase subunit beta [Botrimarina colliarenosi]
MSAGVTLHEALKAYEELAEQGVTMRVVDLYSVKPLDSQTLHEAADATGFVVTIEDHYPEGGIGEAVASALSDHPIPVFKLAVSHRPRSGDPEVLRTDEGISAKAIVGSVSNLVRALQPSYR